MLRLSLLLCLIALPVMAALLSGVKTTALSAQLYAVGLESGDPVLLIAAARLRKSLAFRGNGEAALGWEDMLASEAMAGGMRCCWG